MGTEGGKGKENLLYYILLLLPTLKKAFLAQSPSKLLYRRARERERESISGEGRRRKIFFLSVCWEQREKILKVGGGEGPDMISTNNVRRRTKTTISKLQQLQDGEEEKKLEGAERSKSVCGERGGR